ncbi:MAG: NAD(P)H-dependent oxidoreductase subunit E [Deltaproteobacteria bacterium HGW-Deltaproteobacteria-14]|jgi:NADH-quinone oxidoreductase E subunit|nr:MAG: NAD(P)H-dependent oxidoreductase subunit E [Deltaproteobacteria bacterium HGW-Deltaproteobacteria-14]
MSMAQAFSPQADADIEAILQRYPTRLAALIPTLWVAQREFGWLAEETMELVARRLDLPPAKVISTATFYTMFHKKPVGRYHVQVCKNISCYLRGSDEVTARAAKKLGLRPGETSADGQFTLEEVECLAACGRGPVVQVNADYHEWQTAETIEALLDRLAAGDMPGGA